ncbi:glycoside hydrolase family 130 protein [Sphingomonas sp. DG1-23]|uniref:glycoside hydrolase family 130 protein n=1 Tax=Sphingomonas sp. DG1-23 TaxID=3068316 RepID=UPI00273FC877|nr:glycoside hydrolase family 130 protein [Sphingomonas sp. DG1-23]MDP5281133.1 glycoside hydrolase family 130 protein [Sphingomonas sp. DG1-23]
MLKRWPGNPVIAPEDVRPSRSGWQVDGTFNAGVARIGDEVIMLVRVAESVAGAGPGEVHVPVLEQDGAGWRCAMRTFRADDPDYDFSDPRIVRSRADPRHVHLTSMSHLRVARSSDGVTFTVADTPFLFPADPTERYGCEDARLTVIEGTCYINYTAVSDLGIATALAVTDDFVSVERLGIIHAPDNRDVCLFPRRIGGSYWCLHRPAPLHFGAPEIWIARSPDLIHWGAHERLAGCTAQPWENNKIGGGAQMLETDRGWLQIYHGVDAGQRYSLGALLLDLEDPRIVKARLARPLAEPVEPYEVRGFFDNVVFTCGALIEGDELRVYYGAADRVMALGSVALADLWAAMGVQPST